MDLFEDAFGSSGIDETRLSHALATYVRTLVVLNSPFDRFMRGDEAALTDQQQGMEFFAEANCTDCHHGPMFSDWSLMRLGVGPHPDRAENDEGAGGFRIQHRGDKVYLATDQVELFVLSGDFANVSHRQELMGGLLIQKQGTLESIEQVGAQLLLAGEFGAIWVWSTAGEQWTRDDDLELPSSIGEMELSGMTQFGDRLLAVSDETHELIDVHEGTRLELRFGEFLKEGGDLSALKYSGLASEGDKLYVLSPASSWPTQRTTPWRPFMGSSRARWPTWRSETG